MGGRRRRKKVGWTGKDEQQRKGRGKKDPEESKHPRHMDNLPMRQMGLEGERRGSIWRSFGKVKILFPSIPRLVHELHLKGQDTICML